MTYEYLNEFNPIVDKYRTKWFKKCKNCGLKIGTKVIVLSIYDIRPLNKYSLMRSTTRTAKKHETFWEFVLCDDCLADIKRSGGLKDAFGGS